MRLFGNPVRGRIGALGSPDPVSGFVVTRGFRNPDFPQFGLHDGLDIDNGGPSGDPILAMDAGVVSRRYIDAHGALVLRIKHADGWTTGYAHLDRFMVILGQSVKRGQQIGTLGSSGFVTGPHLHFDTEDFAGIRHDPWQLLEQNQMFQPKNPIVTQEWDTVPGVPFYRPDGTSGQFTSAERVLTIAEGTYQGEDARLADYGSSHEALIFLRRGLRNPGPRMVGSPDVDTATRAGQRSGADAVLEAAKSAAKKYGAS